MDSVLDRIGTSDSDTSDKDYQRPTKKISLKVGRFSRVESPTQKIFVTIKCRRTL